MGKAIITYNAGGGLYRARPLYDLSALESELSYLQAQEAEYASLLLKAFRTKELLESELADVAVAKNEVLKQWLDGLISKGNEVPPAIPPDPPNDPGTGEPWLDPDRAQEQPLLDLINSYRVSNTLPELTRDSLLDNAALNFLRYQASTKKTGHFGAYQSTPESRAYEYGYSANRVEELIMQGATSPQSVFVNWQRGNSAIMLGNDFIDCGVAYKYAPNHPSTHLWCVMLAVPGTPPNFIVTGEADDPIKDDAEQKEQTLEKIQPPRVEDTSPEKLGEIIKKYAIAAAKVVAARNGITQLMAAKMERIFRISELQDLKQHIESLEYDVWASFFNDEISVGTTVYTAEVPGYWLDQPVQKSSVIYEGTDAERTVVYVERSWNIVLRYPTVDKLRLKPTGTLTSESAFYAAAMEPGWVKWKPQWRYGTITGKSGDLCSVVLNPATERQGKTLEKIPMEINQTTTLDSIPINYPPCNGWAFEVADEVIIRFMGLAWDTPEVVGFRRVPKRCAGGNWSQYS